MRQNDYVERVYKNIEKNIELDITDGVMKENMREEVRVSYFKDKSPNVIKFFKLLFDKSTLSTCFAQQPKGTSISKIKDAFKYPFPEFISINEINGTEDTNPTMSYHATDKPRRSDKNVVCFRNILIECDNMPLQDQLNKVKELDMPYSTCVFSGGKSYHYIISLETPLENKSQYNKLVLLLYKTLQNQGLPVDKQNKNPSRLSRCPTAFRESKKAYQDIIDIKERVSLKTLSDFINKYEKIDLETYIKEDVENKSIKVTRGDQTFYCDMPVGILNTYTNFYLRFGSEEGTRNRNCFLAAIDYAKNEYLIEECIEAILKCPCDLPDIEKIQSIRSAYATIKGE